MEKRRKLSAEFKAKVALEALKEQQTLQQLSQKYDRTADAASPEPDINLEARVLKECFGGVHAREKEGYRGSRIG